MRKRSTYRNSFYVYHKVTNISNKDYMGNSKNISKMKVELGIFVFYSDAFPTELTWNFLWEWELIGNAKLQR